MKHYRVDKMQRLEATKDPREGETCFGKLDMGIYTKQRFRMFDGQEPRVTLECEEAYAGVILERFGKELILQKSGPGYFTVKVKVAVSRQFFAWVMVLGLE